MNKNQGHANKTYHIIGDIHGHGVSLRQLLEKLGYAAVNGVYQHPENHQVLFLGDFIDRGPTHEVVMNTVRPMVDQGHAMAVMGNHEFNAVCYHTPGQQSDYLRPHNDKNRKQHDAFLRAYPDFDERSEIIEWFKTLPLWLDLEPCRVIHACWHEASMQVLQPWLNEHNCLTEVGYEKASIKDSQAYVAIETLLKGMETALPEGHSFTDKDGHVRHQIRTKWWDVEAKTFHQASLPDGLVSTDVVQHTPEGTRPGYPATAKPLFIGHYWFKGDPKPILHNLACLDYSIAKGTGGKLVAYQLKGPHDLCSSQFVWCD